jgi:hypothetical protein
MVSSHIFTGSCTPFTGCPASSLIESSMGKHAIMLEWMKERDLLGLVFIVIELTIQWQHDIRGALTRIPSKRSWAKLPRDPRTTKVPLNIITAWPDHSIDQNFCPRSETIEARSSHEILGATKVPLNIRTAWPDHSIDQKAIEARSSELPRDLRSSAQHDVMCSWMK